MLDQTVEQLEFQRKARKLRELFRGRFDQTVAEKLLTDFNGPEEAADFLLTEKPDQVTGYLRETPGYLESLKRDSEYVASILTNGIESSVRQFVCGDCNRSWWKRVPLRKEVSKCRRCHYKYDPIPRDKEWGWGKFLCPCGKEFTGYGVMGVTTCECYQCEAEVPLSYMLPPRRRRGQRKTNAPHTCNGVNCHNGPRHGNLDNPPEPSYDDRVNSASSPGGGASAMDYNYRMPVNSGTYEENEFEQSAGAYPGPPSIPVCNHPKSIKPGNKIIRTVSGRHISTGSTVDTFLSQGSIDTQTVSVAYTLGSIEELSE